MDFDTTTKPDGTLNAAVNKKLKYEELMIAQAKKDQMLKSIPVLERDAEEILADETTVIISRSLLDKLHEVYDSCQERGQTESDPVETADFIASIDEDPAL